MDNYMETYMKKPNIYSQYTGTHSEVFIDGEVMDVDDIAMILNGLIDVLILAVHELETLAKNGAVIDWGLLKKMKTDLKKAGCTE